VILEPNPRISVVWLQDLLESVCGAAAAMARSPNPRQSPKSGFLSVTMPAAVRARGYAALRT
jgi:uncharacterized membrane protein YadS